jgi:hypothetical protein
MLFSHLCLGIFSLSLLQLSPPKLFIYFYFPPLPTTSPVKSLSFFTTLIIFSKSWRSSLCNILLFPSSLVKIPYSGRHYKTRSTFLFYFTIGYLVPWAGIFTKTNLHKSLAYDCFGYVAGHGTKVHVPHMYIYYSAEWHIFNNLNTSINLAGPFVSVVQYFGVPLEINMMPFWQFCRDLETNSGIRYWLLHFS